MNTHRIFPLAAIAVAIATSLGGCSSAPINNPQLDQARSDYEAAQRNPQTMQLAAGEMKQAGEDLNRANEAWTKRQESMEVSHLAYLAKQRVAVARETARQKAADLVVANATTARDQLRTDEADAAQRKEQSAERQSEEAQRQSDMLRQTADKAQAKSSELEAELVALNAKKTDRGMVITLGDVLFDTNKSELKAGGLLSVQKLAGFLREYPKRNAMIEGFTDSVGSEASNQALSDRRADAVRTALLDRGIGSDRITTNGYGEGFPVSSNDSRDGRQLNRRVEIVLSDDNGHLTPR